MKPRRIVKPHGEYIRVDTWICMQVDTSISMQVDFWARMKVDIHNYRTFRDVEYYLTVYVVHLQLNEFDKETLPLPQSFLQTMTCPNCEPTKS